MVEPRRFLNDCAREEVRCVNEEGRAEARKTGDFDGRMWLHEDEWVRMRSPLVVIVGLIRLDGVIEESEQVIFTRWVERWLERSHWGDVFEHSKRLAINKLAARLHPSTYDMILAAWDCSDRLSRTQLTTLIAEVDHLLTIGNTASHDLAHDVRRRLGEGL